jgi:hypothetical protein
MAAVIENGNQDFWNRLLYLKGQLWKTSKERPADMFSNCLAGGTRLAVSTPPARGTAVDQDFMYLEEGVNSLKGKVRYSFPDLSSAVNDSALEALHSLSEPSICQTSAGETSRQELRRSQKRFRYP